MKASYFYELPSSERTSERSIFIDIFMARFCAFGISFFAFRLAFLSFSYLRLATRRTYLCVEGPCCVCVCVCGASLNDDDAIAFGVGGMAAGPSRRILLPPQLLLAMLCLALHLCGCVYLCFGSGCRFVYLRKTLQPELAKNNKGSSDSLFLVALVCSPISVILLNGQWVRAYKII